MPSREAFGAASPNPIGSDSEGTSTCEVPSLWDRGRGSQEAETFLWQQQERVGLAIGTDLQEASCAMGKATEFRLLEDMGRGQEGR